MKKAKLILAAALCAAFMNYVPQAHAFGLGDINKIASGVKDAVDVAKAFTIGDKEEMAIGNQIHEQLISEMGGAYKNKAVSDYVNNIGQKLVKNSGRANIKYTFTVVNADYVNAFAIPGGHVYVTRGILSIMDDEAQLAAVLGHEIGHVVKKHGLDKIKAAVLAEKGSKYAGQIGGALAGQLTQVFANLATTGYGRGQELEADHVGVEMANKSGYDPNGAIRLFEHLLSLEKGGSKDPLNKFFASHPDTKKRIAQVKKEISGLSKKGTTVNAAGYKKIRQKV